jgi:hypothetical protein
MPIASIAMKFKNTHDLAGVAEAIRDSELRGDFKWYEDPNGMPSFDARNLGQLYETRKMNCYEFVHFCAFLCGPQKTLGGGRDFGAGVPLLKATDANVICKPHVTIVGNAMNRVATITRGAVVAGVKSNSATNNKGGFFHIGIATKGTEVIHLINAGFILKDNLKSAPLDDWFTADKYKELWIGAYNWVSALGDNFVAPLPVCTLSSPGFNPAGNDVAAVGMGSRTGR